MASRMHRIRQIVTPRLWENRLLAGAALLALAVTLAFWWWRGVMTTPRLRIAAGIELKYRKDLVSSLADEAQNRDLALVIDANCRAAESIARVASGAVEAAVIPAGMAAQDERIRQVAVFDCEPLQLFVRPEMLASGLSGLKGKRLNLGSQGSGARVIAGDVLKFLGMKAGVDYQDESLAFGDLTSLPVEKLPDGVFSLAPLPSPLGERLVQQYGYRLLELPFGEALGMRKATIEEATVPASTYSAQPPVPTHPLRTVGTRAILIANCDVPKASIRRLLEVLYESDFARRAHMPTLSENAILQSAEYAAHPGTLAYLHRHDPWVNKDFADNILNLRGLIVSLASTVLLVWQWWRRRSAGALGDYMQACTRLEIAAQRSATGAEPSAADLQAHLQQLAALRIEALEKNQSGELPSDQQFAFFLSRIDHLEQTLQRRSLPAADAARPALLLRQAG